MQQHRKGRARGEQPRDGSSKDDRPRRGKHRDGGNNGPNVRQRLVAEAARIMATEGQHNYRSAKQKAAERLGIDPRQALPSNSEVAAALKDYLRFFGGLSRERAVIQQLETAVQAMRWLEAWQPRLSGPHVDDLASELSPVQIHLFSDDLDAPLRFLMDRKVPYEMGQKRIRWYDDSMYDQPTVSFEAGEQRVELWLFTLDGLRQAPPSPVDGRPRGRLDIRGVENLINEHQRRIR